VKEEIECERTVEALNILSKKDFVEDVSIFGNNIHANVIDAELSKGKVKESLESEHSIKVNRIDEITPTLEDVFIHLLEKEKKEVA